MTGSRSSWQDTYLDNVPLFDGREEGTPGMDAGLRWQWLPTGHRRGRYATFLVKRQRRVAELVEPSSIGCLDLYVEADG